MDYNVVPPAPFLKKPRSVSTPDGGLLYIGPRCVVYIGPYSDKNKAPVIVQINTCQIVKDLDVDPSWGKASEHFYGSCKGKENERKFFAVAADDRSVQIFDLNLRVAVSGHKAHVNSAQQRDGNTQNKNAGYLHIGYMRSGNVLSVDSQDFVLYCVASNSYHRSPLFIDTRMQSITAMKCSPFKEHICAFGTSRGVVLVCNMKKCQIVHTFRGHLTAVSAFSWRIINTSLAKQAANNKLEESPAHPSEKDRVMRKDDDNDPFDIYNFDYLKTEFGAPLRRLDQEKKKDPPNDPLMEPLMGPIGDESLRLKSLTDMSLAFDKMAEEISSLTLKELRIGSSSPEKHYSDHSPPKAEKRNSLHSSSNEGSVVNNSESTEGSIEIINYSSSDDAIVMDGDHRKPKYEVLHHIYHQAEVHATGSTNGKSKELSEPIKITDSESSVELSDSLLNHKKNDDDNDGNEIFLFSVSEDSSAWLWNSQTGAVCEGINKLGNAKSHSKHAEIAWLDDLSIVVTDKFHCLSVWRPEIKPEYVSPRYNEKDKYKCKITNIATFSLVPGTKKIWCLLRDRKVLLIDLEKEEICLEVGTVSYAIKAIAECPDDMNKIAIGLMDKRVGIFDISKITPRVIPIQNFLALYSPITCLAWSPDCTKLAYGSIDGKLGVLNIEMGNIMIDFRPKFSREIYSIDWFNDYVYFVCNQCVYAHDCRKPKADAIHIARDSGHATSITVRNDFLLVGIQDGQVVLYRRDLAKEHIHYKRVQTLILIPRYITMMSWNPLQENTLAIVGNDCQLTILHFYEDAETLEVQQRLKSPYKGALITWVKWSNFNENLLLTNDRDGNIIIWDLSKADKIHLIKEVSCPITSAIFLPSDENIVMYSGTTLSLSFFDIKKELTRGPNESSSVNTVWATKCGPEIHTMSASEKKRARRARRRELKKSADKIHADFEFVNSENIKAEQEKEKKEQERKKNNAEKMKEKEKNNKKQKNNVEQIKEIEKINTEQIKEKEKKNGEEASEKNNSEQGKEKSDTNMGCDDDDDGAAKKEKDKELEEMIENMQRSVDDSPLKDKKHNYMTHPATILYLTAKDLNKNTLDKLKIALTGDNDEIQGSILFSNLLKDAKLAHNLMKTELENHRKQNLETKPLASICLNLMDKESLRQEILDRIEDRTLSEWHVALSPTYGMTFWSYTCKAFAFQLIDQGYVLQGATIMLANNKECEAVRTLIQHRYYREALLLCRIGFLPNNPLTSEVITDWLADLEKHGNVQAAALISILVSDYKQGYQYLSKIRHPTPQIEEILQLIKEKGDLYTVLGERRPEKRRISFSPHPPSVNGSSQPKEGEPPNESAEPAP